LGVNALPGRYYDFAVGGKSHFGNTLTITETGAGTAASVTDGTLTLSHTTSDGTGKNSIVFKSASNSSDYGYIQYNDDGGLDSASDENGLLTIGIQNDPNKYGVTPTNAELIKFDVAGAPAYVEAKANYTGGNKGTMFKSNYVTCTGLYADALPLDSYWNTNVLTAYDSSNDVHLSALYQYFDNAHDSDHDLAFTGMNATGGSTVDGSSKPYGYMLRSRSDGYIAYQAAWIDGVYDGSGLALGVNALPGRYYDFAVGGKSHFGNDVDMCGNLTVDGSMSIGYWDSPTYATVNGLLTMKMGIASNVRDYESADYWNAALECGNDYRGSWTNHLTAAYLYVDNGYTASADLLFTGHTSTGGGHTSHGYNLYSKGAVQDGVTDQGLCIQTEFAGTQGFHLGLGDRPGSYQFYTTGDVKFGNDVIVTGSVTESSDERLKTDIEPIDSALDKISRLRGVSYRLRKDYDASSIKHIGMIAQDMQREFPELVETVNVDTDNDGVTEEYYGIKYSSFTAPLVEAIKELKAKNDDLATRNRALEEDNMLMKSQMQEVLARVTALENK